MSKTCEVLAEQQNQLDNEGTALVPVDTGDDGWADEAAAADSRWLKGDIWLFADWQWTKGSEKTLIEKGRQMVALGVRAAWVCWKQHKPVQHVTAEPGRLLPSRESLDDLDETQWELDAKGEPQNPWKNTRYVYLLDPTTAEMATFVTSTFGGRRCVEDLSTAIARMRREHPGATPVVELDAAVMPTRHGRKSRPVLRVVGWKFPDPKLIEATASQPQRAPALTSRAPPPSPTPPAASAGPPPSREPPASPVPPSARDEMNDSIPF